VTQPDPLDLGHEKMAMNKNCSAEQGLNLGTFRLNSGEEIRLRDDKWLGDSTFRVQYPSLYSIVWSRHAMVASVIRGRGQKQW
jgi:hypothetical protein